MRREGDLADLDAFFHEDDRHTIRFECIVKETDKALLIRFTNKEEHWLPKSITHVSGNDVSIPEWLIEKDDIWDLIEDNK